MKRMKLKYYQMETNEAERSASVVIFGDITSWPYLKSDVSAYNLQQEIQALDVDKIDVHINSYGGEVAEALAITNTLMRHKAKVTTYVDGFACSAATIIFMAGDERIVSPASNFLVHPASAYVEGNAEDLRREAENLDTITAQSITMYMRGVTKSEDELISLMAEERFLTPEEVLEWGFATKIDDFGADEDEESDTDPDGPEANPDESETDDDEESENDEDETDSDEDEEEEKNPTQSVRKLVSKMLQRPRETVRIDERQVEELCQTIICRMSSEIAKISQQGKEPGQTKPEEKKQETMLDRFLKAF